VILPGSKATIADLRALRREGWDIDILAHHRRGGLVLGLCGGYQMLGRRIADPDGIEGPPDAVEGLGLLDVETRLTGDKRLVEVAGHSLPEETPFRGYEMHVGETAGPDCHRPLLRLAEGRTDGAVDPKGRALGCYVHGLFSDDRQRAAWLAWLGASAAVADHDALIEATLDAFAAYMAAHCDIDTLFSLARAPSRDPAPQPLG